MSSPRCCTLQGQALHWQGESARRLRGLGSSQLDPRRSRVSHQSYLGEIWAFGTGYTGYIKRLSYPNYG